MGCRFDLNKEKRRKMNAELFDKKAPKIIDFRRFLAPSARFERAAFRLGVSSFASYLVVRDALQYPQTRMNTGFFEEPCDAGCWAMMC